jgi:hypothetical protein
VPSSVPSGRAELRLTLSEPRALYRAVSRPAVSFAETLTRWGVEASAGQGVLLLRGPETVVAELSRPTAALTERILQHAEDLYRLAVLCGAQPTDLAS